MFIGLVASRRVLPCRFGVLVAAVVVCSLPPLATAATVRDRAALGVGSVTFQRVTARSTERSARIPIAIDGRTVTLVLEHSSVRKAGFRVLAADAMGALHEVPAPPSATWRGALDGVPGSIVGATLHEGELTATIALPDGRVFCVQPAGTLAAGAERDLHAVYLAQGTLPEGACTVHEAPQIVAPPREGTSSVAAALKMADLAVDADYELYLKNGSSVNATVSDVEGLVNSVNVVYERDCDLRHRLTLVVVRSSEPDPYTSTDVEVLYEQMRSHWNTTQSGVARDMVHLMTGKNLDGGTIGYAGVGVVCNRTHAYGLSESRFSTNFGRRTALVAHELGHNWNADHCDGISPCHIMCSSLGGCDGIGLPNFEPTGASDIKSFAASRTCLDSGPVAAGDPVEEGRAELVAPSPSPFTLQTSLGFYLPAAGRVRLDVFDALGRRLATLVDGDQPAGWHVRTWNGTDQTGTRLGPGVFHARLETERGRSTRRMVLVR